MSDVDAYRAKVFAWLEYQEDKWRRVAQFAPGRIGEVAETKAATFGDVAHALREGTPESFRPPNLRFAATVDVDPARWAEECALALQARSFTQEESVAVLRIWFEQAIDAGRVT